MLIDMNGNRQFADDEVEQIKQFYELLVSKKYQELEEIGDSLSDFPTFRSIYEPILKFALETFHTTMDILDTGVQKHPILKVKEDCSLLQKRLIEEAKSYLEHNLKE